MTAQERTFQIHLEGLIRLLAQNLYADPDIFLREMIQNAHDSIARRNVLAADTAELPGQIRVVTDPAGRTIAISDNGTGLTQREIDDYLSTIGQSGNTDELRHRIREADRGRTIDLIGQFGIGLLSAFIVAERVSLVTRAAGHKALLWESGGGETYQVSLAERTHVGTTVTLHLRPEHDRYLEARLRSIIRSYADFIGLPVYLNDESDPANAVNAPWHRDYPSPAERDQAYREFWERKFADELSLQVFAVDEEFAWDDVAQPGGRGRGRVKGVLAITDQHVPDVNARGTVDVYVKRMFIAAGNRDVLPAWAKFLQGVLECDELTPNAARDNVVRNAALAAVQRALGSFIVTGLTELSQRDRKRFVEIMRWHSYHLLAMSVQDEHEEFFRAVADLIPLESDQGPLTVPEYLRSARDSLVYYITEQGSANQYYLLASARDLRVFNCDEPFAERFLRLYAKSWPGRVQLQRLDVAGSQTIFEPLTGSERAFYAELQAAYGVIFPDQRCSAEVSRFRPADVPAVLTETRDGRSRREMENVVTNLSVPSYVRNLLKGFLTEQREPLTLHLNADNPIVRKLAARPNLHDEVSRHALISLYNNALMLLARSLRTEDVQAMFVQYNQVIDLLLSLAADRDG